MYFYVSVTCLQLVFILFLIQNIYFLYKFYFYRIRVGDVLTYGKKKKFGLSGTMSM